MYFTSTRVPVLRSPFTGLRQINRLFDEALNVIGETAENGGTLASAWVPACDVFEGRDMLKIVMEVPGVASEDIKLSLENNQLSVRGEKRQAAEEQTERVHRYERSYGAFERVFTLPATVDAERIEAKVEHGVLTVMLPKVERARPREIPVVTS
jgi:HSP20 family protein